MVSLVFAIAACTSVLFCVLVFLFSLVSSLSSLTACIN